MASWVEGVLGRTHVAPEMLCPPCRGAHLTSEQRKGKVARAYHRRRLILQRAGLRGGNVVSSGLGEESDQDTNGMLALRPACKRIRPRAVSLLIYDPHGFPAPSNLPCGDGAKSGRAAERQRVGRAMAGCCRITGAVG